MLKGIDHLKVRPSHKPQQMFVDEQRRWKTTIRGAENEPSKTAESEAEEGRENHDFGKIVKTESSKTRSPHARVQV